MKQLLNGLIKENPVFVLTLGLCSALAVTNKVENAYLMGISVLLVLIISSLIISLIKKLIPTSVQIPVYIVIIGTIVTILELLLKSYVPDVYKVLGIYLPIIIVNCIILGRALSVYSKESVSKSLLDAIGIGLGYTLALLLIALPREIFGSNTITLMDSISSLTGYRAVYQIIPTGNVFPMKVLTDPAGAFLVLGFILAIFAFFNNKRKGSVKK